jgi:hypothetical protein
MFDVPVDDSSESCQFLFQIVTLSQCTHTSFQSPLFPRSSVALQASTQASGSSSQSNDKDDHANTSKPKVKRVAYAEQRKCRLLTLVYYQNINMLRLVVTATLTAAEPVARVYSAAFTYIHSQSHVDAAEQRYLGSSAFCPLLIGKR